MISFRMYMTEMSKSRLRNDPIQFNTGTIKGTKEAIKMLQDDASRNFSGANQLQTRSGYLRRSIKSSVRVVGLGLIEGSLGSDAIYAAIQEYGGVITASAKNYLTFIGRGGWVKVKSVTIPPRPFLSTAIDRNKVTMRQRIINGINKEI